MIFSWRQLWRGNRLRRDTGGKNRMNPDVELTIPSHFRCPISLDLMKDPVTLSSGITYDRENIEKWIEDGNQTCPVTNQVLTSFDQIPNHSIRKLIQDWCVENKSFGIERIPTPRIPITPSQVYEISSTILSAVENGDSKKCQELVGKIKVLARESERNKICIKENGVGYVLATCFDKFSDNFQENEELLKYILSELTWIFPLGSEGLSKIGSSKSLRTIAWILNGEDLSSKQHGVMILKELHYYYSDKLREIEGIPEALFKIIKVPICPKATKASLMVIYHMLSTTNDDSKILSKFLDMGLVSLLIEMIVEGEKGILEKSLGVLDKICSWKEGKEKVINNALAMPLIVKKILRISDLATEFCISILWKLLCNNNNKDIIIEDENNIAIEAMEVGGFQKLLVILQVGCGEKTKEKTNELLKMMNLYKDRVNCVDSSTGFKYLKRTY